MIARAGVEYALRRAADPAIQAMCREGAQEDGTRARQRGNGKPVSHHAIIDRTARLCEVAAADGKYS